MYCLDCGTKIGDDELQCPHCGSSVADMKERIAAAEEKVAYTDAVCPSETSKLPLVSERTYTDKDGNPLDPAEAVDVDEFTRDPDDLRGIPAIGDEDPYITKPMQRIVADSGEVVADVDRTPKEYRQDAPKRRPSAKTIAAIIVLLLLAGSMVYVNLSTWFSVFTNNHSKGWSSQQVESAEQDGQEEADDAAEQAQAAHDAFAAELDLAYTDLGAWRDDVADAVEGLEGYYLVKNRDTREGYADACVALIDDITASRDELASQASALPSDDELVDAYSDIDELYGYLLDRLGVIYQCWEVSLSYDDPSGHDSDILAPIVTDLENGHSASEAAFDALYPEADPSA